MALGQRPRTSLLKIYIMVRITFLMEGVHTCIKHVFAYGVKMEAKA